MLCSSSARTRETWALVAEALPEASPEVRYLDSLYLGEVADVLTAVAGAELRRRRHPRRRARADDVRDGVCGWRVKGSDASALALVRVGVPTASLSLLSTDDPWQHLTRSGATLSDVLTSPATRGRGRAPHDAGAEPSTTSEMGEDGVEPGAGEGEVGGGGDDRLRRERDPETGGGDHVEIVRAVPDGDGVG